MGGGLPDGPPWQVVLPTTLIALDGTQFDAHPTARDPAAQP
jgi:hypothetical protein